MGKCASANMTDKLFRIRKRQKQTAATPSAPQNICKTEIIEMETL